MSATWVCFGSFSLCPLSPLTFNSTLNPLLQPHSSPLQSPPFTLLLRTIYASFILPIIKRVIFITICCKFARHLWLHICDHYLADFAGIFLITVLLPATGAQDQKNSATRNWSISLFVTFKNTSDRLTMLPQATCCLLPWLPSVPKRRDIRLTEDKRVEKEVKAGINVGKLLLLYNNIKNNRKTPEPLYMQDLSLFHFPPSVI